MKALVPLAAAALAALSPQARAESRSVLIVVDHAKDRPLITIRSDDAADRRRAVDVDEACRAVAGMKGWGSMVRVFVVTDRPLAREDRKKLFDAVDANGSLDLDSYGREPPKPLEDHLPKADDPAGRAATAPWRWSDEEASLADSIDRHLRDCRVEVVYPEDRAGRALAVRVLRGDRVVCAFDGHPGTVLARRGDAIFVARFRPEASGCEVVAHDLVSGKVLWKAALRGLGPVEHSRYRNRVNIGVEGDAVVVRGWETEGRYIELLDPATGKTVGHRVYTD